jgi:Cdc6-like AAA superfamily ATPase
MTKSKLWFLSRRRTSHDRAVISTVGGFALAADPPVDRGALSLSRLVANPTLDVPEVKREAEGRQHRSISEARGPLGAGTSDQSAPLAFAGTTFPWGRSHSAPPHIRSSVLLRKIFTPTRPKQDAKFFFGRGEQLRRIISAVEDQHAHIVIHGERGSGKTSLANVVADKAEAAGYVVLRFVCSAEASFDDMLTSFLHRMPAGFVDNGVPERRTTGLQQPDPRSWGLQELLQIFGNFASKHLILIIDEYDRVTSEATKARLAELMKNLSDAAASVTLLIIGIAENVTELLGKHPSLQRALMAVPLPLMTRDEIESIIAAGEEKSGLRFESGVRQTIVDLAHGLPYHAQLLCYFAARSAVWRHSNLVERQDLRYAVQRAVDEAHSDIKLAYDLAVRSKGKTSFRDVLFLAARCPTDEFGTFRATDAAAAALDAEMPALPLLLLQRVLKKLSGPDRGAVLRGVPSSGGVRYRFASQMLRHYVLCREGEERGLLPSLER